MGLALAEAAMRLIGCRFRLHGRDPAAGLDCVGLVAAALTATGASPHAPTGYRLRNLSVDHWLPFADQSGLVTASGPIRAGDILLIALGHCQHHLAIAADETRVVHAHAALGQVVLQPRDPAWQIIARWRRTSFTKG